MSTIREHMAGWISGTKREVIDDSSAEAGCISFKTTNNFSFVHHIIFIPLFYFSIIFLFKKKNKRQVPAFFCFLIIWV